VSDRLDALLGFYATRGYGHRIGPGRTPALLVIDWSRAFTQRDAGFPGGDFTRELAETRRILDAARGRVPTFFTTIAYEAGMSDAGLWVEKIPWLKACQLGAEAVDIDPALGLTSGDTVIVKKFPSAFHGTDLAMRLTRHGVDTLIVAGCTTSVCVRATVVDAMQHGYRTLVAREAVGDFLPDLHRLHLADLDSRYADVVGVEDVISYLRSTP
jgi:maleamate amidohydrolase